MCEHATAAEKMLCGDFTHDVMVEVVLDLIPTAVHGRDFLVAHSIMPDGEKDGDPFFLHWRLPDEQPEPTKLKEMFEADRAKYVARLARSFRAACLAWSDGKADAPSDAPEPVKAKAALWAAYRQALRDLTSQPGFPLSVKWPVTPI
ncbi:hypothetical protein WI80_28730 [Burkholderia ubonensis]|uniref:XkdW family protein n=1 Tax=Burkholderia ubonensis TaxID=101571 RepID=UPI00075ADD54|nr:phage tail assembly chaperone [Burkholderia ubonensis]KVD22363.1 hypothetical protein WI80_28730 [Burkholderia ubonensis]KVD54746.1 hypothetical protein WI87_23910 [Burkholderia ubonensis]KVU16967.1 hypothetical protein WK63_11210 [Burkholderia ubonensis]KWI10933.1 hypothetical protein WM01_19470 [Burkholderia ubonensis]KWK57278.1 hypothetical protein WM15_18050 [Burkholderia ubonensis]